MATNSLGELQWQYQMNGVWRTLNDNQGRIINDACVKNATNTTQCYEMELVVRGKPHLAKWLPDATSDLAPDEFARLTSFELVTETVADFGDFGAPCSSSAPLPQQPSGPAQVEVSAGSQLRQRQQAQKEADTAEHNLLVAAEHAEQTVLRQQMKESLDNENPETR